MVQGKRGNKGFGLTKGNEGLRKGGFRTAHLNRVQAVFFINTNARAKIKKEEAREEPIHRQDFQLMKIPLKRDKVIPGNQTIGQEVLLASQKPKVLLGICKCLWPPASLLQLLLTPSQRTAIRLTRGLQGRRKIHWLRLFQKLLQAFGKVDIALADLSRVQPFFSLTTQKQGQRSKRKRQGGGTRSNLGIRRSGDSSGSACRGTIAWYNSRYSSTEYLCRMNSGKKKL